MAQFDLYENPNPETRDIAPLLLDVQSDLLDGLSTRVVVPLVPASAMGRSARHLNPGFRVGRQSLVLSTAELAGVPVRMLGRKVGSLAERRADIIAALDFLFTGY